MERRRGRCAFCYLGGPVLVAGKRKCDRWTAEHDEALRKMRLQGHATRYCAEQLGRTYEATKARVKALKARRIVNGKAVMARMGLPKRAATNGEAVPQTVRRLQRAGACYRADIADLRTPGAFAKPAEAYVFRGCVYPVQFLEALAERVGV